ncbi:MAG: hypothetical protein ACI9CE_002377, partial [Flavobacterium sp.]
SESISAKVTFTLDTAKLIFLVSVDQDYNTIRILRGKLLILAAVFIVSRKARAI